MKEGKSFPTTLKPEFEASFNNTKSFFKSEFKEKERRKTLSDFYNLKKNTIIVEDLKEKYNCPRPLSERSYNSNDSEKVNERQAFIEEMKINYNNKISQSSFKRKISNNSYKTRKMSSNNKRSSRQTFEELISKTNIQLSSASDSNKKSNISIEEEGRCNVENVREELTFMEESKNMVNEIAQNY